VHAIHLMFCDYFAIILIFSNRMDVDGGLNATFSPCDGASKFAYIKGGLDVGVNVQLLWMRWIKIIKLA